VYRSNFHIYAQLIDDDNEVTLASASTNEKGSDVAYGGNVKAADLKRFLPERMLRFTPGDRPVAGSDLVLRQLLGTDYPQLRLFYWWMRLRKLTYVAGGLAPNLVADFAAYRDNTPTGHPAKEARRFVRG
jgi:hypothetical protein